MTFAGNLNSIKFLRVLSWEKSKWEKMQKHLRLFINWLKLMDHMTKTCTEQENLLTMKHLRSWLFPLSNAKFASRARPFYFCFCNLQLSCSRDFPYFYHFICPNKLSLSILLGLQQGILLLAFLRTFNWDSKFKAVGGSGVKFQVKLRLKFPSQECQCFLRNVFRLV